MKRILLSFSVLLVAGSALAASSTGAWLSDKEKSVGNTFTAGAIDLKIDNTSYYNGNVCAVDTHDVDGDTDITEYVWQGGADFPEAGESCTTTWLLDELNNGAITLHKFFDFIDIKPADYSEDTISLHVNTNDAYLCADVTLTSDNENTHLQNEIDDGDGTSGPIGEGELADNVNFIWWADDGDNVLEDGENVISSGPIGALTIGQPFSVTLADSDENIWTGTGGPIKGGGDYYIGKAWCFGKITAQPLLQSYIPANNRATSTPNQNGNSNLVFGEPEDGGYSCQDLQPNSEDPLDNTTQTDSLTADITFKAVQSRHNEGFQCTPDRPETGTLVINKLVVNDNTGQLSPDDFSFQVDGSGPITPFTEQNPTQGQNILVLPAGPHSATEPSVPAGYTITGNTCIGVVVPSGGQAECLITNNDIPPDTATLRIQKVIVGGPLAGDFGSFSFQVDAGAVTPFDPLDGINEVSVTPDVPHNVIESPDPANYDTIYSNCENVNIPAGGETTCTITNTYAPSCNATADVMLVLDRSSSIEGSEQTDLKNAALGFVSTLNPSPTGVHMGQSSFGTTGSLDQSLTNSSPPMIAAINGLVFSGNTNLYEGLSFARTELASGNDRDDSTSPDIIVVITDGNPNEPGTEANARAVASAMAAAARADGATIYVVGVGADVDAAYLSTQIASSPSHYFPVASFASINTILQNIANCQTATLADVLFSDGFGDGGTDGSFDEAPVWTEAGVGAEKRAAGVGNDSASPGNAGRFAFINTDNDGAPGDGFMCSQTIDASLFDAGDFIQLSYEWRGDSQGEGSDFGLVQYATGGTCDAPTGLVSLTSHALNNSSWQTNNIPLGAPPKGITFYLRFGVNADNTNENFRVDDVSVTAIDI